MQSTPLTYVRTSCGTSSVRTAVLHSYMLRVCRHYRWLHSYALLVYRQHRRPAFVRVAEPRWYTPLSYICTLCASAAIATGYICTYSMSAVNTAELHSYALQNLVGMHCCPTFVPAACLPSLPLATFVVCRQHRVPPFVRAAERHWYTPLSYIRTCCSSAVNIVDLRSYALQNIIGSHRCRTFVNAVHLPPLPLATFVHAPCLLSTSSTCVRTCCRTSLVHTAVLHSYTLHVCLHYCWLHS